MFTKDETRKLVQCSREKKSYQAHVGTVICLPACLPVGALSQNDTEKFICKVFLDQTHLTYEKRLRGLLDEHYSTCKSSLAYLYCRASWSKSPDLILTYVV